MPHLLLLLVVAGASLLPGTRGDPETDLGTVVDLPVISKEDETPSLTTDSDTVIRVQVNGSMEIVFDLIGFELDVSQHQSSFVTPDAAFFLLSPNDTVWKTGDNIVLSMSSHARRDPWRVRYSGSGPAQMGFQLEGVSMYDSGKWMVRIHHNEQWVTATFELVVTNFDITTDADLNISIEEGGSFALVFDLVGFDLSHSTRQSAFITPDSAIFWLTPDNDTWKGLDVIPITTDSRPGSWRVRYEGSGVTQMGLVVEGASPHDSGRWTLRVPTLEYGDHWVTKHFMVTVGNSSIIPETPRLTTDMDLPIYTRVNGSFSIVFDLIGFEIEDTASNRRQSSFVTPDGSVIFVDRKDGWKNGSDLINHLGSNGRQGDWRVRYEGNNSTQQMGIYLEGASSYDNGNWTLRINNGRLPRVSVTFEVLVYELKTERDFPIEIFEGESFEIVFDLFNFELTPSNKHQAAFFTPDVALMWVDCQSFEWKNKRNLAVSMMTGDRSEAWRMRYEGNGTTQVGMRLEGASIYDNGEWIIRVRHDGAWVETTFEVSVKRPELTTEDDDIIRVQVNGSIEIVYDLGGFELDLSLPTQSYILTPDSAFVNLVPNDTDWKDGNDITLGLSSSHARPDGWRIRYSGSGVTQMGFQLEGVTVYDSGKWMVRIRHQNSWVLAVFDVIVTNYDVTTDADLDISIEEGGSFSLVWDVIGFELSNSTRQSAFITPDNGIFWLAPGDTSWKRVDVESIDSKARPEDWRVRYNGSGVQQIGVTLEGASPHDSGRWTLRVPTLGYGDHWVTKHFMVTVGNSSIIPETPRLTATEELPVETKVNGTFSIVYNLIGFEMDEAVRRQSSFVTPDGSVLYLGPQDDGWKNGSNLINFMDSNGRLGNWRVRYEGNNRPQQQQMGIYVEGVSVFDLGEWTLRIRNGMLPSVIAYFEVFDPDFTTTSTTTTTTTSSSNITTTSSSDTTTSSSDTTTSSSAATTSSSDPTTTTEPDSSSAAKQVSVFLVTVSLMFSSSFN